VSNETSSFIHRSSGCNNCLHFNRNSDVFSRNIFHLHPAQNVWRIVFNLRRRAYRIFDDDGKHRNRILGDPKINFSGFPLKNISCKTNWAGAEPHAACGEHKVLTGQIIVCHGSKPFRFDANYDENCRIIKDVETWI
jgi:hypothetical protein